MNDLNKKLGFDVNEMKNAAQNGQLDEFVKKNLSQKATKQLKMYFQIKRLAKNCSIHRRQKNL